MTEGDKLQLIHPPSPLKMKVGIGEFGAPPEASACAEPVIANLSDDYLTWAEEEMTKLQAAMAGLKAAKGNNKAEVEAIFQIAHAVKGQFRLSIDDRD